LENKKLEEFERYIRGKKVAIIGMGVSNIHLLDYLYNKGSKVIVFDRRALSDINQEAVSKINQYSFELIYGENSLDELVGFDIIFRSPSCRPDTPQILREVERGAIVTSEIEMVLKLTPCKIIGITGTEGKTTTTSIIHAIIQKS